MNRRARYSVLGVGVDALDLAAACEAILAAARERRPLGVSALAVHGLTTAALDPALRRRINALDLVVPDGQPVRWALNWLHGAELPDRVFGPDLMFESCVEAAAAGLPVFFYGSTSDTLARLASELRSRIPTLEIAGQQPSRFRAASEAERSEDVRTIRDSGARIVFVGLGCPRQEIWTYENRRALGLPVLAVGAAFDYHAGLIRRAPRWMQRSGLEWLCRLRQEPGRLWRRYLILNPLFLLLLGLQFMGLARFRPVVEGEELPPVRPG